jgi:hypothetical protein
MREAPGVDLRELHRVLPWRPERERAKAILESMAKSGDALLGAAKGPNSNREDLAVIYRADPCKTSAEVLDALHR